MPCTPVPKPALPTPPAGLTISAPLPAPDVPNVNLPCCTLPKLPPIKIPNALGPMVIPAAWIATLRQGLEQLDQYLDAIPLDCPRQ